jgi:hypothetical protein
MLTRRTLKVFLWTWFSFAWFFVAVIAAMNSDLGRSFANWLVRGIVGGFFVGALTAYLDHRQRVKSAVPLPDDELKPTASERSLVE